MEEVVVVAVEVVVEVVEEEAQHLRDPLHAPHRALVDRAHRVMAYAWGATL